MADDFKMVAKNRKARFEYTIEDSFEAGMVLVGTEVKSLRQGRINLRDGYARIKAGELWLENVHITPYPFAHYGNHEPLRSRKLLVHKREIRRLTGKVAERGYSLIPLSLYFKKGRAKIQIGLAKGKKAYDKRRALRERQESREIERALRRRG
ncbi:MAG: SsrA-binding protein SmpB [Deltaproteobacteria bacterium]|nr:SsrA-binding protein SmpB [Deltaproteobacteria bacterium]